MSHASIVITYLTQHHRLLTKTPKKNSTNRQRLKSAQSAGRAPAAVLRPWPLLPDVASDMGVTRPMGVTGNVTTNGKKP